MSNENETIRSFEESWSDSELLELKEGNIYHRTGPNFSNRVIVTVIEDPDYPTDYVPVGAKVLTPFSDKVRTVVGLPLLRTDGVDYAQMVSGNLIWSVDKLLEARQRYLDSLKPSKPSKRDEIESILDAHARLNETGLRVALNAIMDIFEEDEC